MTELTPVVRAGPYWAKREDQYCCGPANGVKLRQAEVLLEDRGGIVGYGGRRSNTAVAMAMAASTVRKSCLFHTADGPATLEMETAEACGAKVVRHRPGYLSVLRSRAARDAADRGWRCGLAHPESIAPVRRQCRNLTDVPFNRLVVACGSGVTLAGILAGMDHYDLSNRVVAVIVGAEPEEGFLDANAPPDWRGRVDVKAAPERYDEPCGSGLDGIGLDELYEAKCVLFMEKGDLLWIAGRRPF